MNVKAKGVVGHQHQAFHGASLLRKGLPPTLTQIPQLKQRRSLFDMSSPQWRLIRRFKERLHILRPLFHCLSEMLSCFVCSFLLSSMFKLQQYILPNYTIVVESCPLQYD